MASFNGIVRETRDNLHTIDEEQRKVDDLSKILKVLNSHTMVGLLEDWAAKRVKLSRWRWSITFLNHSSIATEEGVPTCDETLS